MQHIWLIWLINKVWYGVVRASRKAANINPALTRWPVKNVYFMDGSHLPSCWKKTDFLHTLPISRELFRLGSRCYTFCARLFLTCLWLVYLTVCTGLECVKWDRKEWIPFLQDRILCICNPHFLGQSSLSAPAAHGLAACISTLSISC